MKKAIIFLIPILIIIALNCSKDHDPPTFSKFNIAEIPTNVEASYDQETDTVYITWDMDNTTSIVSYFYSVSDSSDFDMGNVKQYSTHNTDTNYSFDVGNYIPADTDSTILYFTVSAVYKDENLNNFIGPRADIADSALIKRD